MSILGVFTIDMGLLYNLNMSIYEELKSTLAYEAVSMTKISKLLLEKKNYKLSMNNLSRKLREKTIKYEEVRKILDILGYDIKFVKRK